VGLDEMSMSGSGLKLSFVRVFLVLSALLLWEVAVRAAWIDSFYFSSPTRIAVAVARWWQQGLLLKHLLLTIAEAGAGFFAGLLLGLGSGFFLAANPRVDAVFQPFVVIANALPRISFAPLIVLWFGLGFASKVVIVVSVVFFLVFFNTYRGFKEVSPVLLKNARVVGATPLQMFFHIYLPASLAWTFASLRVSVGFSITAAILGEYIGSGGGIGFLIDTAQSNFDATGVMAGLAILTVMVIILDNLVKHIERRVCRWHPKSVARTSL
jgi:NitT/TauT family transport system permease protein